MSMSGSRAFACMFAIGWMLFTEFAEGLSQNLSSASNRADYVVIAPSSYLPLAEQLASFHRQNSAYVTMAVSFDSVLAAYGSASSPDSALKSFLQCALQTWQKPAPKYFVLVGNINAIPSHREPERSLHSPLVNYDSLCVDHWYVEESPQAGVYGQAQAILGRLPAWDSAGLAVTIRNQIDYASTPPGAWWNKCIGLADYDTSAPRIFESDLWSLQCILSTPWPDTVAVHIDPASPQHLDSTAFMSIWDEGAAMMVYCGHANPITLSATRFITASDVDSLKNQDRLSACFFDGCNLRFDQQQPSSIPVDLLELPGAGAVACVASAGDTFESAMVGLFKSLFAYLATNPNWTAGEAFARAKNDQSLEILRRVTFLGDPAVQIKRPVTVAGMNQRKTLPAGYALNQNYPNPFNPSTTIGYTLPEKSHVNLTVHNTLGQNIATLVNENQDAGYHEVRFDGSGLASGVYFYRLVAGTYVDTKKLTVLR